MKIGYFCYNLSGNGPRVRAQDVINGIASETDHTVVALTSEPHLVSDEANQVVEVSVKNPFAALWQVRKYLRDCDVVHVPINIYQVTFVRLGYNGPLVGGIGPGLQKKWWHLQLAKLTGIDVKVRTHEYQTSWMNAGIKNVMCTATIDTTVFYPYSDEERSAARRELNIPEDQTVILYVGSLSEEKGAGIVDQMAREYVDDTTTVVVVGDGPLKEQIERNENIRYAGFVPNKDTPKYYNVADVTIGPRKGDVTSNVGLESIACGTPYITTAEGVIKKLFYEDEIYVWANRTPEAVWDQANSLLKDEKKHQQQVERGLQALEDRPLTLENAIETHSEVYEFLHI